MLRISVLLSLLFCASVAAETYPTRPVTIMVSQTAGTAPDIAARIVGDALSRAWDKNVLVLNRRPGLSGTHGAGEAARAPADGYTLFLATPGHLLLAPFIYHKLDYDPDQFEFIYVVGLSSLTFSARHDFPADNVEELIELAKQRRVTFATSGVRNQPHALGEALARVAGISLVHVPYKSVPQAIIDTQEGRVDLYADGHIPTAANVRAGKMKVLVRLGKPLADAPSARNLADTFPVFDADGSVYFLVAPAGTPSKYLEQINQILNRELGLAQAVERLESLGLSHGGGSTKQARQLYEHRKIKMKSLVEAAAFPKE
jgi:tripartite-type tricarboxylate transporter receptor subunit TctC